MYEGIAEPVGDFPQQKENILVALPSLFHRIHVHSDVANFRRRFTAYLLSVVSPKDGF